jgi:hypothetical protein
MKILKGDYKGFIEDVLYIDDNLIKEIISTAPQVYGATKDLQNNRDD